MTIAASQNIRRQKIARLVSRVLVSGSSLSTIDSRRISERLTIVAMPRTARPAITPMKKAGMTPMPQITIDDAKTEMPKRTAKIQISTKFELAPGDTIPRTSSGDEVRNGYLSATTRGRYEGDLKRS